MVQCIQTVLNNAVTITTSRAPTYTSEGEQAASDEQKKEEDDLENPRKVAPLLTHVSLKSFFVMHGILGFLRNIA